MMSSTKKLRPRRLAGFTLVELLVALAIVMLLAGILVPSLTAAREYARSLACLNHQRACGQGLMAMAVSENRRYPAAYEIAGDAYATWAGMLATDGHVGDESFTCPAFEDGGLPRANFDGDGGAGQVAESSGAVDVAPARCAYAVNEAVLPRPRFETGEAVRPSRRVRMTEVESDVILLTEFDTNWRVLSPGDGTCRSYLPVHGLVGIGPMGADRFDLNAVTQDDRPCFQYGGYRRYREANLIAQPVTNLANPPRLNLLGRNHGRADDDGFRRTSFTFADGHAVSMTVPETLQEDGWGHKVYSVTGDQRIAD